jgi:hypothetical protein
MLLRRRPPCAEKANRHVRSTPPPAVMRLFVSVESSGLVHRVKSTLPPAVVCLFISVENNGLFFGTGPRPTSHAPWALASVCGEGKPPREEHATAHGNAPLRLRRKQRTSPPREEHATACGSVPLHLHRKHRTSLWHGGPGPRVMLFGRRPLCAEKANRRTRSMPPPAVVCLLTSAETNSPVFGTGA